MKTIITPKQRRLSLIKDAKKKYKMAREHQSEEFIQLRNHTFNELTSLNKRKFDCGVLTIKLLP